MKRSQGIGLMIDFRLRILIGFAKHSGSAYMQCIYSHSHNAFYTECFRGYFVDVETNLQNKLCKNLYCVRKYRILAAP